MSSSILASHVRIKRVYEPPAPDDGARILIDRLWPRGVKKEAAELMGLSQRALSHYLAKYRID